MAAALHGRLFVLVRFSFLFCFLVGLLLLPGCGKSDIQIGLSAGVSPSVSSATVLTGGTADITAIVTGTSNKQVVWSVCDGNGSNCVTGGNAVRGTILQIGTDSQGNSIARYTAPSSVPAPPDCRAETAGCSVVVQGFLTTFNVSCFTRVTVESSTNPVPTITSLMPSSAIVGGPAFTLTVNGTGYNASSVVRWNGGNRTTTFVSSNQLQAAIPASDIAATGTAQVTVFNPPPDGGTSNIAVFNINNPTPVLTTLRPATATEGGAAFTLAMDGSGFLPSSVVHWNGSPRTTTFVNSTVLEAAVPASDIAAAGTANVTVVNPGPGGGTSNALTFTVSSLICTVGVTQKVSVASGGTPGDAQSSHARISGDGRFVTFFSLATNLVANDTNGESDLFRRDTCLGAGGGCTPSTERVSLADDGSEGMLLFGGVSFEHGISSDARFVAFSSTYPNLVAGDTNGVQDVFLRDTCLGAGGGCTPSTIRVSVSSAGAQVNGASFGGSVSADGRFVVFESGDATLVPGDANGISDVFVRDTCVGAGGGCTPTTVRVSVDSNGNEAVDTSNTGSGLAVISPDGRFVVFWSAATNLVTGDTNGTGDLFVHDRDTDNDGIFDEAGAISTERVSVATDGSENMGVGGIFPFRPAVTPDFRFVAFFAADTTLVPGDTDSQFDVFVRDTCRGAMGCTPSTVLVSAVLGLEPDISPDGRFVAFRGVDVILHDRDTDEDGIFDEAGAISDTTISVNSMGTPGNGFDGRPVFNANSSLVAFDSMSTNFVAGDTATFDVFLTQTCVAPPP